VIVDMHAGKKREGLHPKKDANGALVAMVRASLVVGPRHTHVPTS